MKRHQLNTLLVNSSQQDFTAIQNLLANIKEWQVNLDWVSTYEDALTKIKKTPYDIYLLNYHSNEQNSLKLLRQATQNGRTTLLILLLDSDDDNLASEGLQAGAVDYLVRNQLDTPLLERSIRYAVKHKQLEEKLQKRLKKQTAQVVAMNEQLQQEIDRYRRIEEILREREQQYRMFFHLDVYGVEVLDTEGYIVNCNTTYEIILGYSRKEIIGQHTTTFASDKSKKLFKKKLAALEKQGYTEGEIELIRKDGAHITLWRRYRAIYDEAGTWTGIVAFNRDITKRMKAVKQISSLAWALEQSPVAIMIIDEIGKVEYVNFRYTELTEYDYEEMIGQNLQTIQSESLSASEYKELWAAVNAGNEWHSELRSHKKGGAPYWESILITPMFDDKGKITHFIVVKDDITKRKRIEAETIQTQQRVGDLMSEHISDLTATNEALEREIADRKRAERMLRRNQARLKAQYKGLPLPTYSWQKTGDNFILVDYNDAAERETQGQITHFIGRPASKVFKGKEEILADFERCFDEKRMVKREAPYQLVTDDENKHFETTYNFVPPNLVVAHIEDITQYKQVEQELKDYHDKLKTLTSQQATDWAKAQEIFEHEHQGYVYAEKRLKEVTEVLKHEQEKHVYAEEVLHDTKERLKAITSNIDNRLREQYRTIPIPAYSWQAIGGEFILIDFNDAAAEVMGRIVDFLGKSAGEIFKDRPQVLQDFSHCFDQKRTVIREAPYQLITTGENKYFKTTYDYVHPNLVIVHIEDITQHKQMEEKLNEYRRLFEKITVAYKAELVKRNEAVRQEIHKRKQSEYTLKQLKAKSGKHQNQLDEVVRKLTKKYNVKLTESNEALNQEIVKRQEAEQALSQLAEQILQHHENLEDLVQERTSELTRINDQLQREIVEYQRAEDSLNEARARLKTQYKGIPIPTYSWQRVGDDFILIDFNNAAEKASHGSAGDLIGKPVSDVFKDRPQVLTDFSHCFKKQITVRREAPYKLLRTNETKYFVTTYNFVPPNLIIVYIEDISEYKRTEEALKESEMQIELMCRFSPKAKLTFVNNVYCWYFNQSRADLIGQEMPFILAKDFEKVKKHFASFSPENPVGVIEYRVVKPNGVKRWQQWMNHAFFDNQGQLVEIQSIGRDITKRKERVA
jgi:PAS domain S-box-containing protein